MEFTCKLLEWKFSPFFFLPRYQFVALDNAGARVPPEQRVVVSGRPDLFRFLEPFHRVAKKVVRLVTTVRSVLSELGLGPALRKDTRVIRALIFTPDARQQFLSLRVANSITFGKPIG